MTLYELSPLLFIKMKSLSMSFMIFSAQKIKVTSLKKMDFERLIII